MDAVQSLPFVQQFQSTLSNLQRMGAGVFQQHKALSRPPKQLVLKRDGQPLKRVNFSRAGPFAAIIPGDTLAEQVVTTGLQNFLQLYNSALIVRLVLTWFPAAPEALVSPLSTLCDPYLNLFRGIIPPLGGGIDFSPILAFVTLSFFTNTAAALPCEMGPDGRPLRPGSSPQADPAASGMWAPMSQFQAAWQRRVAACKARQEQA